MAGTLRGRLECLSSSGTTGNNVQEMYTNIYSFFKTQLEPAGVATEVAMNYGTAGTGVNYWDQANPFTTNSFFVFRFETTAPGTARTYPWYILVQYTATASFATPGDPGSSGSAASNGNIFIATAVGVGGDQNPWNGTGAIGASRKGGRLSGSNGVGPVWTIPSGGTDVLTCPRGNYRGGAQVTNKERLYAFTYSASPSTTVCRYNMVADSDSFFLFGDVTNTAVPTWIYAGIYNQRSEIVNPINFITFGCGAAAIWQTDLEYNWDNSQGGALFVNNSVGVRALLINRQSDLYTTVYQPNLQTSKFDAWTPSVYTNAATLYQDANGVARYVYGKVGDFSFIQEVYNVAQYNTNTAGDKVVIGAGTSTAKMLVPWSSTVVPLSGTTRIGTNF